MPLYLLYYRRRRVAFGERDADDAAAARLDGLAADDGVERPVGAFDEHIRLQPADDLLRVVFVEHHDRVHTRERRQDFGSFALGIDRTRRSLDGAHRSIRIDRDDQRITFAPRVLQVTNMARVEKVEHAVGEHDFLARHGAECSTKRRLLRST